MPDINATDSNGSRIGRICLFIRMSLLLPRIGGLRLQQSHAILPDDRLRGPQETISGPRAKLCKVPGNPRVP